VAASEKPFIHFISAEAVVSAESLACVAPLTTNDAPGSVWTTSAEGQKRKWPRWNGMSVLPSTTDIVRPLRHVRFVPVADQRYLFVLIAELRQLIISWTSSPAAIPYVSGR